MWENEKTLVSPAVVLAQRALMPWGRGADTPCLVCHPFSPRQRGSR